VPLIGEAELTGNRGVAFSLAWSPDGRVLAAAGHLRVELWDAASGESLGTLEGHRGQVWGVAWSPDGSTLASASTDGTVRLWGSDTLEELQIFDIRSPMSVTWSPDGSQVAAGSMAGNVGVWDVGSGALLHDLKRPRGSSYIIAVDWCPDGTRIASGQWDGAIVVWDAGSGGQLQVLEDYTNARCDVNGLAWSPDGKILASAHQDGKVRLWDSESWELVATLERHAGWARGVAWSPDGRFLASSGQDASVRVWDVETGQLRAREVGGSLPLWSVVWSPDGTQLAAGNGEYQQVQPSSVWMWTVPPDATSAANPQAAAPEVAVEEVRPVDNMTMVYVPGGTFEMGSSASQVEAALQLCEEYPDAWGKCELERFQVESPQHTVSLDGFWLDRTEVTNAQYSLCVEAGDCRPSRLADDRAYSQTETPVAGIPWRDAAAYCAWAGGRLPTEAEWEYAARGSEGRIYPWGDEFDCAGGNFGDEITGCDDGYAEPAPVGSFAAGISWCGALDMAGNAWEWVADAYGAYPAEDQANPTGPASGDERILRGGSWAYYPPFLRTAHRYPVPPTANYLAVGFRCVVQN
jgi:formylglycine-generating enzyme required for sulfatase activity